MHEIDWFSRKEIVFGLTKRRKIPFLSIRVCPGVRQIFQFKLVIHKLVQVVSTSYNKSANDKLQQD